MSPAGDGSVSPRPAERSRQDLQQAAAAALNAGDDRNALAVLLELDDRFDADPWVLESLISLHRRLRLFERGLAYVRRYQQLTGVNDLVDMAEVHREFEQDQELWYRYHARLARLRGWTNAAVRDAIAAASVEDPTPWTLRILTEATVAGNRRELARPILARARAKHPDDVTLAELQELLDG